MRKFVNHLDHAVYLSKSDTVDANIAQLETLTDCKMERCERPEMGCVIYADWSAGLEIIAPTPQRTDANRALYERLDSHGEGLLCIVYGVADLDAHKARMEAKGFEIGPLMANPPNAPWADRLLLRERFAPPFMGSWLVFSQIDYADELIRYEGVKEDTSVA